MPGIMDLMNNVQAGYETGQARGRRSALADLMGQAFSAPESQRGQLYGDIGRVGGPEAVASVQKAIGGFDEARHQDFGRMIAVFSALPKDQKQLQYPAFAQRMQADFGVPVPQGPYQDSYDDGMRRIALAYGGKSNLPSGYQEFDLLANDANLSPGDREKAARQRLYLDRKPSNAALKYMVIEGPDRRKRVVAMDPNQAGAQVIGSGETYGAGVSGAQPAPAPTGSEDQVAAIAQSMLDSGIPSEMIDQWVASHAGAAAPAAPNLLVSSTPGEQAYDKSAGEEDAKLDRLPRRGGLEADNAQAKAGAETTGKSQAEARFNLPKVEQSANMMLKSIRDLKNDPALKGVVGLNGKFSPAVYVPGSPEQRALTRIKQINGQVFLQAYQTLRGGGQITEVEGEKATEAMARLGRAQSYQDYLDALNDLETVINNAVSTARKQANGGSVPLRYNPATKDFD